MMSKNCVVQPIRDLQFEASFSGKGRLTWMHSRPYAQYRNEPTGRVTTDPGSLGDAA